MIAWRRLAIAGSLVSLVSVACTGGTTPSGSLATPTTTASASPTLIPVPMPSAETDSATDVPITPPLPCDGGECQVPADVIAPVGGEGVPTIVLLPGGPVSFADRRYLSHFGEWLAARGAVVFLTTYRSAVTGNGKDQSLADVRCAVSFARAHAAEYGGDPDRVILVGHSVGSQLAIEANAEDEVPSEGCLADGSGVADVVVALAGFSVAAGNLPDTGPPVLLMSGGADEARYGGEPMAQALRDAGLEAEYVELPEVTHEGIITPEDAPLVVDRIFEIAERLAATE